MGVGDREVGDTTFASPVFMKSHKNSRAKHLRGCTVWGWMEATGLKTITALSLPLTYLPTPFFALFLLARTHVCVCLPQKEKEYERVGGRGGITG